MNPVIADAGALVALLDRSDAWHKWAVDSFKTLRPPLFTCGVTSRLILRRHSAESKTQILFVEM